MTGSYDVSAQISRSNINKSIALQRNSGQTLCTLQRRTASPPNQNQLHELTLMDGKHGHLSHPKGLGKSVHNSTQHRGQSVKGLTPITRNSQDMEKRSIGVISQLQERLRRQDENVLRYHNRHQSQQNLSQRKRLRTRGNRSKWKWKR